MHLILLALGLVYAVGFWLVGRRYPGVALALVFGSAPFQNDLSAGAAGVKFSFAEVNLVLAMPLFAVLLFTGERKWRLWPLFWPCVVFSLACALSSLVEWRPHSAPTAYVQQFLFFFVVVPIFALLPRRADELKLALWSLVAVCTFLGAVALVLRKEYILGLHKNGLGGSLACALIVALELWFHYREQPTRHKFVLLGAMVVISLGLLMSLSRGGWLSAVGGIVFISLMRRQFLLLGRVALVLVPFVGLAWGMLPQESRDYATSFSAKRGNIKQRYINADNTVAQWRKNYLFGAGMGLRKEIDATNFVIMALAETGIVGFVSFLALFGAFYTMIARHQKAMPRDEFAYSLFAIGGALMLARLLHGLVDHYWARGPTMMAWASAGMATGALWAEARLGASSRLRRAKALLALHLIETRRRVRAGAPAPSLSSAELAAATQAFGASSRDGKGAAPAVRAPRSGNGSLADLRRDSRPREDRLSP